MPRLVVRLWGCPRFGATCPLLFPGAANQPTVKEGIEGRPGNMLLYGRGLSRPNHLSARPGSKPNAIGSFEFHPIYAGMFRVVVAPVRTQKPLRYTLRTFP